MSGRGKAKKTLALVDAAVDILSVIQPATVRAVCYQLFIRGVIPSMGKNSTNAVSKQLVWAREQGLLPWEWVVDETREAERISTWAKPDDIINAAVRGYRRDYWQDQPQRLEVHSEKGTVRGTLAPVLDEYGITLRVMHGYGSATSIYDIATETRESSKPLTILYVGDFDPSGLHMSEVDLPRRLERYNGDAAIIRVALTSQDVGPELPAFEAESKRSDPRFQWFTGNYGSQCWELDAMSPVALRQRVKDWIVHHLDVDLWNHAIEVEKAETESMQTFLQAWNSKSWQASKYSGEQESGV